MAAAAAAPRPSLPTNSTGYSRKTDAALLLTDGSRAALTESRLCQHGCQKRTGPSEGETASEG